ncbi:MAG: ATP synthase subunit C [Candidatus Helarchaeota archaeon]
MLAIGLCSLPVASAAFTIENSNVGIALSIAAAAYGIGGGYAVARTGTSALSASAERPEIFFRSLIVVGLAEGIAIYGLVLGIFIIMNL